MTSLPPKPMPVPGAKLPSMLPKKNAPSEPEVSSRILPWLAWLAYWLLGRMVIPWHFRQIRIQGQEHLPHSGAVILAPLHRSRWDALIVPYATGRRVTGRDVHFMVSLNEIKSLQGWFIRRLGGLKKEKKTQIDHKCTMQKKALLLKKWNTSLKEKI